MYVFIIHIYKYSSGSGTRRSAVSGMKCLKLWLCKFNMRHCANQIKWRRRILHVYGLQLAVIVVKVADNHMRVAYAWDFTQVPMALTYGATALCAACRSCARHPLLLWFDFNHCIWGSCVVMRNVHTIARPPSKWHLGGFRVLRNHYRAIPTFWIDLTCSYISLGGMIKALCRCTAV